MARLVPSRALLPQLLKALDISRGGAVATVCGCLSAIQGALENGRRVEVSGLASRISEGLLDLLDYRWRAATVDASRHSTIVDRQVGRTLGALILRVSGDAARSLVGLLLEWGTAGFEELKELAKGGEKALIAGISRRTSMYTVLGAVMRAGQEALVDVMGDAFEAVCADLRGCFVPVPLAALAGEGDAGEARAGQKRGRDSDSDEGESRPAKKLRADDSSGSDADSSDESDSDSDSDSDDDDGEDEASGSQHVDAITDA